MLWLDDTAASAAASEWLGVTHQLRELRQGIRRPSWSSSAH